MLKTQLSPGEYPDPSPKYRKCSKLELCLLILKNDMLSQQILLDSPQRDERIRLPVLVVIVSLSKRQKINHVQSHVFKYCITS